MPRRAETALKTARAVRRPRDPGRRGGFCRGPGHGYAARPGQNPYGCRSPVTVRLRLSSFVPMGGQARDQPLAMVGGRRLRPCSLIPWPSWCWGRPGAG